MKPAAAASLGILLAACTVGPDYRAPEMPVAAEWKSPFDWQPANPGDTSPRGAWWQRYGDAELDRLEAAALQGNTTLATARARLLAARARATIANAALLPELDLGASASRSRLSASRPTSGGATTTRPAFQNVYQLPLSVQYEVDLFGTVRRGAEAARAEASASVADLESARLVVAAEVANDYFALREADAEVAIDERTVAALTRARDVIAERHRIGTASGLDLAAEQAALANVRGDLADARRQRAGYENALAVLVGAAAPDFRVGSDAAALRPDDGSPYAPAPIVPSRLLERRPDVAAAERRLAAASAAIGVARGAYFPILELSAAAGYESVAMPLLRAPNLAWSIGAALTAPLFDAGRRGAGVDVATAGYDAAVAAYRQAALTAFAETEDALAALRLSGEAVAARQLAATEAERTLTLATRRYEVGIASYLDVVTAQQTTLGAERALAQAVTRQRLASVLLVKAVGGDY